MSLAEKFQITIPYSQKKDDDGNEWVFADKSYFKPTGDEIASRHKNNTGIADFADGKYNGMAPGMDISQAPRPEPSDFNRGVGGCQDVSGKLVNDKALSGQGFTLLEMKGTDDQYSGEHVDLFYGVAVGDDGNEGFVERNNYLDRI